MKKTARIKAKKAKLVWGLASGSMAMASTVLWGVGETLALFNNQEKYVGNIGVIKAKRNGRAALTR
jgi:hypothetical protein